MTVMVLTILFLYILIAELYVSAIAEGDSPANFDYILLLGAAGDSEVLMVTDRVKMAIEAKKKYPQAKIILSGNEKRGEISVYKTLLANHHISDYLEEPESTTTWDNLIFTRKLISDKAAVLIVTSSFHRRRALAMAKSLGMNAAVFSSEADEQEKSLFYVFREHLAIYKNFPVMLKARFLN